MSDADDFLKQYADLIQANAELGTLVCELKAEIERLRARLAEAERERDALANTLETIAHDGLKYHGEYWSPLFAKSALSALEHQP